MVKRKPNIEAFRSYLSTAWEPIPLHANGKAPRDARWTTRAYIAKDVIRRCADEGRNMGIQLKADQLVIDVDPRNGGDASFKKLCRDLGLKADHWPRVETGSGGSHYYLTLPAGVSINKSHKAYPGLDFISKGGQVVAAGSIHPDTGKHYTWDDFNGRAEVAEAPQAPAALLKAICKRAKDSSASGGGEYNNEQIAAMLASLNAENFDEHDKWFNLMAACHHASGGDACAEFVEWSTSDPKYSDAAEEIETRWDSLHADNGGDRVTAATLLKFVRDEGDPNTIPARDAQADFADEELDGQWLEGGTSSTQVTRVESRGLKLNRAREAADTYENALCAVFRSGISPAWDELKQCAVFRAEELPWREDFGRVLNDHVARLVRMYFVNHYQGVAYSPGKDNLIEALMTIAYGAKFNPVLDYLDFLKWDGTERVARLFPHYFNCGDDAYTRAVSRCFMVGAVRRMREPGCKFDTMPILRSPQGWEKSTAVRTLFGTNWYSDSDLGNLRDKDSAMKLRGMWVQEFAEIESLTRAETGALKAFCSRATDRQRDPYGRLVEDSPRRCVFIATVNEGGYLKDSTGARRFWPLEVSAPINVARIAADRDQLWAEAAALEAKGVSAVLPRELWAVAADRQADQTSDDPWADTLADFLAQRGKEQEREDEGLPPLPPDRVHTGELFSALGIGTSEQTKDKAQRLRVVMELVLGWHHRRGVRVLGRSGAGYTR